MRRIPMYTRHRFLLRVLIMLLGMAAAVLSRYELMTWVVIVCALSSAFTSWMEFADSARKVERYTRAITALKKLLSWWKSLTEVERASTDSISTLITRASRSLPKKGLHGYRLQARSEMQMSPQKWIWKVA